MPDNIVNTGILREPAAQASVTSTTTDRRDGKTADAFQQTAAALLGNTATFATTSSINLDMRQGALHSTTGIPVAIGGTATVVSQKVGLWLAGFQDPIKAILGVGVHRDEKIIIRRKYVVGQSATITPERAPARTVAIQEDVREVTLTRYGGDIEMNLNLFLRPSDAKEELDMKVDAQKRELERALVELGYRTLMQEGTLVQDAIVRSNPTFSGARPEAMAKYTKHAARIYRTQIFGALNKFRHPVAGLLTACKYASAYSTGTQRGSVMLLPHGAPEILAYARKESVEYNVTGFKQGDMHKPITMQLDEAYVDPSSGVKLLIKHPSPHYDHGAAHPTVQAGDGLSGTAYVCDRIDANKGDHIMDLETGILIPISQFPVEWDRDDIVIRCAKVIASSAILAAPGSSTGELLIGYPFTGCSTSQAEERMRIQLRCYLGAVLYQPENVLVLPNVFLEGIQEVYYFRVSLSKPISLHTDAQKHTRKGGKWQTTYHAGPDEVDPGVGGGAHCNYTDETRTDYKGSLFLEDNNSIRINRDPRDTDGANIVTVQVMLAEQINGPDTRPAASEVQAHVLAQVSPNFDAQYATHWRYGSSTPSVQNSGEFGALDNPAYYMGMHGAPPTTKVLFVRNVCHPKSKTS
jgi:hypothetical protein